MIDCDRFDVLTALFPFVEVPQRKPRPVLVLSPNTFHRLHGQTVAAMITTGAGSHWPSDIPIDDIRTAGLQHRSVVRLKFFTLPFAVIGRKIGSLSARDRRSVRAAIDPIFCSEALVEATLPQDNP